MNKKDHYGRERSKARSCHESELKNANSGRKPSRTAPERKNVNLGRVIRMILKKKKKEYSRKKYTRPMTSDAMAGAAGEGGFARKWPGGNSRGELRALKRAHAKKKSRAELSGAGTKSQV